ncbi:MAG TPA: HAD family phosphatase [Chryseosolibacter sp.]|nr:HAD family phosphatase [Chryseosolibacter sp.]
MDLQTAFIFDMDGVIVDSNPYHKIALKEFCKKHGRDLSEAQLREKIYGRRNQDWLTNIFGPLDAETMKRFADEKEALFRDLYEKDIRPLDGLVDFLNSLNGLEITRVIATSAPRANVDFTLRKTGTTKYFSTILDDSFVSQGKPNPEVYLKAAAAVNQDPACCVVFEDSLAGVSAAKDAGCKVVGITTTHTHDELTNTDMIIDNFTGLDPKLLISRLFS